MSKLPGMLPIDKRRQAYEYALDMFGRDINNSTYICNVLHNWIRKNFNVNYAHDFQMQRLFPELMMFAPQPGDLVGTTRICKQYNTGYSWFSYGNGSWDQRVTALCFMIEMTYDNPSNCVQYDIDQATTA